MDQSTSQRYLESKEELQRRMDDSRHSISDTVGEIREELSAVVDWETYVQRYPGTCLMAGGALGWAIGRKLGSNGEAPTSFTFREALPVLPSEPSTVSRMADIVASAVFAQVFPMFAAKMREFFAATSSPVRE